MSNRVGSSTIYSTTLPNNAALSRLESVKLSKQARHRLAIIEHYLRKTRNVSLTCRHFAIARSYFYKWYKRYNPNHLASLEDKSRRPHRVRSVTYDHRLIQHVRRLRKQRPVYSAKKIARILVRDEGIPCSAATIGRIIKKFKLYFSAAIKATRVRSKRATQAWKKRKPYLLKAEKPRSVVEFDMKHIYLGGVKQYAFVAVDVFTKEACIHLAMRPSSYQAKLALEHALTVFGKDIVIVNDNGSENLKHAYEYLKEQNVAQYFARPHTPKDKPHVENLIGKLQQECLDESKSHQTLQERAKQITEWLNDYHFYRPHQALQYLTPDEYCATLGITIHRREVSTM